ncbi:uncharacterized protein LOC131201712 [Ahaetulla prasina]|uniref:uncharacterized protein LOC131201712 n=1 Tax=Ahaetulla prasina TaxID=499056 RepID=UPI002647C8FF|nr:uncharacterized protein LOC131201712 [Ahaetulla prasina]
MLKGWPETDRSRTGMAELEGSENCPVPVALSQLQGIREWGNSVGQPELHGIMPNFYVLFEDRLKGCLLSQDKHQGTFKVAKKTYNQNNCDLSSCSKNPLQSLQSRASSPNLGESVQEMQENGSSLNSRQGFGERRALLGHHRSWSCLTELLITLKLVTTFKALHGMGPGYLRDCLLRPTASQRSVRSHRVGLLGVPSARQCRLAIPKAFSVGAPTLWNELPPGIRQLPDLRTFRRELKTRLFHRAGLA